MTFGPESTLRPLRQRASDLDALRAGASAPGAIVRVAHAADTTLRRMLRDDPTAAVELRLRALSEDDLSTPDLLAELRRRNRVPLELAAAFHELHGAAERIGRGADALPRDAELALSVAGGIESHVLALPPAHLEDPALPDDDEPLVRDDEELVHAVPAATRRRFPWQALLALGVLGLLLIAAVRTRGDDHGGLQRGEQAFLAGRVAEAEREFRAYAGEHPRDALARVYLARIYREAGRPADARRELQAGLDANPEHAELHAELGYLLLDARQAPEAVERFRVALRHDRESLRAWGGLVRALRESGRAAEADQELRRAPAELRTLMRSAPREPAPAQP
ncbi:MAG: tetratricopeptide repeat protein [Gemmatimonadetes bacterium]|nr:tetratricopeptide repeat protein [Gemmatimonadota bacterium]